MHLLVSAWIAIGGTDVLDAKTSSNCDAEKLECAKKASQTRAKRPGLEAPAKGKSKVVALKKPKQESVAHLPPKLVPRPERRPPILQPDRSKLAPPDQHPTPPVEEPQHPADEAFGTPQVPAPVDDGASCRVELLQLDVDFSVPDDVAGTGQCNILNPVQLRSIQTSIGTIELPGLPVLNCLFARRFTLWLSDIAAPVVAALGEAKLASISTGPGYQCRGKSGVSSGKTSEHAFGNAIDIAGITLANNKRIEIPDVADEQATDHRLLMALRTSACGYFTTVLGPGADAAHASHYHFDLGIHGKSGNYRICE